MMMTNKFSIKVQGWDLKGNDLGHIIEFLPKGIQDLEKSKMRARGLYTTLFVGMKKEVVIFQDLVEVFRYKSWGDE
jgi:hypothetical protein